MLVDGDECVRFEDGVSDGVHVLRDHLVRVREVDCGRPEAVLGVFGGEESEHQVLELLVAEAVGHPVSLLLLHAHLVDVFDDLEVGQQHLPHDEIRLRLLFCRVLLQ